MESSVRAFDLFLIDQALGAVGKDNASQPLYLGDRVNWIDSDGDSQYGKIIEYRKSIRLGLKVVVLREKRTTHGGYTQYPKKIVFSSTRSLIKVREV